MLSPDEWAGWPDDKLLDLRISQLGVTIEGSALEARLAELQAELDARGCRFSRISGYRPNGSPPMGSRAWRSPFYLAHPGWPSSNGRRCSKSRGAPPSGA